MHTPTTPDRRPAGRRAALTAAAMLALALGQPPAWAGDTTPADQLARWTREAGRDADAARGGVFFASRHGSDWSCASCHGERPLAPGRHASTGKAIDPIAPAANPDALTSTRRIDKWLRRNCNDVLGRECSAGEKADVIAFLIGLR